MGELELEHALVEGLEEAGELELEQAYIDFLLTRAFNLRAGMLLVPVGIINERHEPPVFHGVERPFVDTVDRPEHLVRRRGRASTARSGDGLRYRAYVMAPLDAAGVQRATRASGAASQKGAEANVRNVAFTGPRRVRRRARPHLGASVWSGESGFSAPARHHRARRRGGRPVPRDRLELRGQFAQVTIGDAAA